MNVRDLVEEIHALKAEGMVEEEDDKKPSATDDRDIIDAQVELINEEEYNTANYSDSTDDEEMRPTDRTPEVQIELARRTGEAVIIQRDEINNQD